jgi:hypothetical protein
MIAYELLAKLRKLTLAEEGGEISWIGTFTQWQSVDAEEYFIIKDWELKNSL